MRKFIEFSKKNKFHTEIGKNSTSILIYKKPLKKNQGKIGILTAGTF